MSTNKTPNLNMNSWVGTDNVKRTEFNENFNAIDTALGLVPVTGDVRVATTANITLSGTQTIDEVALAIGDRVLVKNQTTASQNGIYNVQTGAWTRAADADTSAKVAAGIRVYVKQGTANAREEWWMTNTGTITIGTTAITFEQVNGPGSVTAEKIANGSVTAAKVAADVATQAELDAVAAVANAALQDRGVLASNANWNTITNPGAYLVGATAGMTNHPNIGASAIILEVFYANGYIVQRASSVISGAVSYRTRWDSVDIGAWSAWRGIITTAGGALSGDFGILKDNPVFSLEDNNSANKLYMGADENSPYIGTATNSELRFIINQQQVGRFNTVGDFVPNKAVFMLPQSANPNSYSNPLYLASRDGSANQLNSYLQSDFNGHLFYTKGGVSSLVFHEGTTPIRSYYQGYPLQTSTNIAANTWTKVWYEAEQYDHIAEFNPANSVFTAQKAGVYLIFARLAFSSMPSATRIIFRALLNGSAEAIIRDEYVYSAVSPANLIISGMAVVELAAGATIEIDLFTSNACTTQQGYSGLSIVRLL